MRPSALFLPPLLLLVLATPARTEEEGEPFEARVTHAIERGAAWLAAQQRNVGDYPAFSDPAQPGTFNPMDVGLNALVVLTLAHCGVDPDAVAIKKCLNFCRTHYSGDPTKGSWNLKGSGRLTVYTAAALIMALIEVNAPGGGKGPRIKYDRYGKPQPPKRRPDCKMSSSDKRWVKELVAFLVEQQVASSGGWRYPGNPVDSVEADTDLSNTQYALLGLDAAARCGIDAPIDTWVKAGEHVLREQEEEGIDVPLWVVEEDEGAGQAPTFREIGQTQARGWGYLPGHNELPTGSMTCAGVTCLAMVKERLWLRGKLEDALSRRLDRGMLDGLAWLADRFTVKDNPEPPSMWHYYYLYGLERTGSKTGVEYIGRHDWYREGAEHLLAAQLDSGAWKEAGGDGRPADTTESAVTQTCFALLFLERATQKPVIPVTPPTLTGGGGAPREGR